MKKKVFALLLLVAVVLSAIPAYANIEFQLANSSGRTIREIWVGPSSNTKWLERDKVIRGGSPLRSGRYTTIELSSVGRSDVRYWDLRVDFVGGGKKEWHEIDMWADNVYQIEITRSLQLRFQR